MQLYIEATEKANQKFDDEQRSMIHSFLEKVKYHVSLLLNRMSVDFFYSVVEENGAKYKQKWESVMTKLMENTTVTNNKPFENLIKNVKEKQGSSLEAATFTHMIQHLPFLKSKGCQLSEPKTQRLFQCIFRMEIPQT